MLFGYNTKFSGIANKEMYGLQLGEFSFQILGVKGLLASSVMPVVMNPETEFRKLWNVAHLIFYELQCSRKKWKSEFN